jgi:hypothetical protein
MPSPKILSAWRADFAEAARHLFKQVSSDYVKASGQALALSAD